MKPQIPWLRVFVEGVVIVLFALGLPLVLVWGRGSRLYGLLHRQPGGTPFL